MDLYFSDKRQTYNHNKCSKNSTIIKDHYYLIYGVRISSELYHAMIDYVIESGEWEGEIMEFIEEDEWNFFETEGRSKPDRYEWLEGFLEEIFKFKSIMNLRGEDVLYMGNIIWSSKDINMDKNIPEIPIIKSLTEKTISDICNQYKEMKLNLDRTNKYWSENLENINYYWITGSD
jgi:hypothetical protein